MLAHARHGLDAQRNVMISPNAVISDAVARFSKQLALDDGERSAFEISLVRSSGIALNALELDRLAGARDSGLLVIHDREDREIPVRHGDRLAASWPNAKLLLTDGLGHRRILRDEVVIAETVAFVREGVRRPASDLVREVDALLGRA
jgi:pimeloyl-ACP methyl ester carboxylesterase